MDIRREHKINFWFLIAAMIGVLLIQTLIARPPDVRTIPYSTFLSLVKSGGVTDLRIDQDRITGRFTNPAPKTPATFETNRVDPALATTLGAAGISFAATPGPTLIERALGWILPVFLFGLIWLFLIRRMAGDSGVGGMMSIGKSRAKIYVEKDIKVTFADVAGVDEAKAELQEVVDFLR
ncbi:MAG: cell division protein FtsH, partial [Acidiphilium sp. 37-67-22]